MKYIKVLSIIAIISGILYFLTDSKLYYYGRSDFNICNHSLPLGLKPKYLGADFSYPSIEFSIRDKYGFTIVEKGVSYPLNNDTIEISEIIKYGYKDLRLVVLISDCNNNEYYIICEKYANLVSDKDPKTYVRDKNIKIDSQQYKWIKIEENKNYINTLLRFRTIFIFIFIITSLWIIFMIVFLIRKRSVKRKI